MRPAADHEVAAAGEVLCEVSVEKVAVAVDSPVAGVVSELLVDEREPITAERPLVAVDETG